VKPSIDGLSRIEVLIKQLIEYLRFVLVQVYDMTFELNEVEARQEEYPSTLSYLNLLNVLIEHESDAVDKGARYVQRLRCGLHLDLPTTHARAIFVSYLYIHFLIAPKYFLFS